MVSRDPRDPHRIEEGRVACSPDEWAGMTLECLSIPPSDPQKNDKLWSFGITDHAFSSGSKLSLEHYLRFRILWYTWPDPGSFRKYIRNNPDLLNDNGESTRYDGYISPESDRLANEIYNAIKPKLDGYLDDIRRVGQGDPTRPSEECGAFENTRYWQGLVSGITKQVYDEDGQKVVFRGKVRKSEAASLLIEDSSPVPRTPLVNGSSRQPQQGFGTPHLAAPGASAGGLQNPATSDEGFVNVALVLMLQAITRLMRRWEEDQKAGNSPSGRSTSRVDSQTISSAPSQTAPSAPSQTGFRASSSGNPMDSTPASSRASSPTSNQRPDDYSEEPSSSSASSPAQVRGLGCLDWLITRLPLRLTDSSSEVAPSEELMQARVDGYLSRRHFMRKPGDEPGIFEIRRSELPLAILEAKPFTRLSALSATRWQESAEMAAWVSGLDDEYEDVGLLQSSRSGRKRSVFPMLHFPFPKFCAGASSLIQFFQTSLDLPRQA